MNNVFPKKNLGQHFLKDKAVARKISESLSGEGYNTVLEIGPGMGILTENIFNRGFPDFRAIEIDNESVHYLKARYAGMVEIIPGDFLTFDLYSHFQGKIAITGNFPYNISSQILFRILDHRDIVAEVCGMLQREVAQRICEKPGSRTYGILSVLIQAFYLAEYLFSVTNKVFYPAPKVQSGVIRLKRNQTERLDCDEDLFFRVVKACFNQRRKKLRNSVRSAFDIMNDDHYLLPMRPEQLSVNQFVELTNWIEENLRMRNR
jgi:16S rRNA (adenine1518-N6/adenine1519-N6)-dimethyltransferase